MVIPLTPEITLSLTPACRLPVGRQGRQARRAGIPSLIFLRDIEGEPDSCNLPGNNDEADHLVTFKIRNLNIVRLRRTCFEFYRYLPLFGLAPCRDCRVSPAPP